MNQEKCSFFSNSIEGSFPKIFSEFSELELSQSNEAKATQGKKLSSVVGVVGLGKGRVHIEMNEELAKKLFECSNGEPVEDEMDLCFYLAELANMIVGNGITVFNNAYKGSNLRLTPPAIFADQKLDITTPQTHVVSKFYHSKFGAVRIEIGFDED